MFKDDRMISMLSAIVLMVAIGTIIQRADGLSALFGGKEEAAPVIALNDDAINVPVDTLARIDVLANDEGLDAEAIARFAITSSPACGRLFVQGTTVQYLPEIECSVDQSFTYSVPTEIGVLEATARLTVIGGQPAPASAPTIVADAEPKQPEQTPAPAPAPQVSAADPKPEPEPKQPRVIYSNGPSQQASVQQSQAKRTEQQAGSTEVSVAPAPVAPAYDQPALKAPVGASPVAPQQTTPVDDVVATLSDNAEPIRPEPSLPPVLSAPEDVTDADPVRPSLLETLGAGAADVAKAAQPDVTTALQGNPSSPQAVPSAPRRAEQNSLEGLPDPERLEDLPQLARLDVEDDRIVSPDRTERGVAVSDSTPADLNGSASDDESGPIGFLVALFDVREPTTEPPAPPRDLEVERFPRSAEPHGLQVPEPDRADGARLAALSENAPRPTAIPGEVALGTLPVDRSQGAYVPEPPKDEEVALINPTAPIDPVTEPKSPTRAPVPAERKNTPDEPAEPAVACDVPSSATLDIRNAGQTGVSVVAPCHANTVAELSYSGLRFAVPIDAEGQGGVIAMGFEANAPALLRFVDGETIDFDLPFKGVHRITRVALVWDQPISLELNALEFGAAIGSENHVRPDNPRSFAEIRRSGGGFLQSFRAQGGVGLNAEIYTYFSRRGGTSGIVKMMIDFASRSRDGMEGTCGAGPLAAPEFLVLRSEAGRPERPILRKLAPLDCSSVAEGKSDKHLISSAVADLIVSGN